jgi:hypothetical protein
VPFLLMAEMLSSFGLQTLRTRDFDELAKVPPFRNSWPGEGGQDVVTSWILPVFVAQAWQRMNHAMSYLLPSLSLLQETAGNAGGLLPSLRKFRSERLVLSVMLPSGRPSV